MTAQQRSGILLRARLLDGIRALGQVVPRADVEAMSGVSRSATSKHLIRLEELRLVRVEFGRVVVL